MVITNPEINPTKLEPLSFKPVKNNFNGLVFQNDLEKKIISLVQNVSLYNKLQDRAYLTVSDNYNISKTVKSYFNKVYI